MNKTEDKQKYMRDYMKQRYNNDKVKGKMYRNTCYLKSNYPNIDKDFCYNYKYTTSHIIKIIQLINELPTEYKDKFLSNFDNYKNTNVKEYLGTI